MFKKKSFSKIIETNEFLKMSSTTQNLYFHLEIKSDDDGFVPNPKKITKIINSTENDMKILLAKKFIILFDNGICVIKYCTILSIIRQIKITYKKKKKNLINKNSEKILPSEQMKKFLVAYQKDKNKTIKRLEELIEKPFTDYEINQLDIFVDYWSELNQQGNKQRWELQKTFELLRRFKNWVKISNTFPNQQFQNKLKSTKYNGFETKI